MNRELSKRFSISFLVTLIEMSLYHAYMVLFLVTTKGIENSYITRIFAFNFIISLVSTPIIGEIIEKREDKKSIIGISLVIYIVSILTLFLTKSYFGILVGNVLYNLAKMPILRLQEMLGAQAHYEGLIDFGQSRSKAALGYAFAPLVMTVLLNMLGITEPLYPVIFIVMALMILINTRSMLGISNAVILPKRDDSNSFLESVKLVSNQTWFYLSFAIISGVFYNSANNFIITFQSVYFQQIFSSTQFLGVIILIGSIFEWPVMRKTTSIIEKLSYFKAYLLVSFLQACRWLLYYGAGLYGSFGLFVISSSLNGILQAIYIPLYSTFIRRISSDETYGSNFTIISTFSSLLMWVSSQGLSYLQESIDLQNMFLVLVVFTLLWSFIILIYTKTLNRKSHTI